MSDLTFVISRALNEEDVEYTIGVYRSDAGFLALWECSQCTE
jgi:hypothetical protein